MTDYEKQFENFVNQINFDDKTDPDHRDRLEKNLLNRLKNQSTQAQINIWTNIIKAKLTKLAAAAVIIIAVTLGLTTILDKSATPAYAIEQTVEAFKNIRFMHVVNQNESGQLVDERWIEIGPDGIQARYRQYTPGHIFVVDDRKTVYAHYKDKDMVVLYDPDDHWYTWIHDLGQFFNELSSDKSSYTIEEYVEYNGRLTHHIRWLKLGYDAFIDPTSKLPIAMQGYEISYEEPPEGTFEIPHIPEGIAFFDKRAATLEVEKPEWMKDDEIANKQFEQAKKSLAEKRYEEAVELFKNVVVIQPMRNWAWYWLGRAYHELDQYDAAIEAYSKFTGQAYIYYARSLAYAAKAMEEPAKKDIAKALPTMILALRNIEAATLFDVADDPKGRGTEEQRLIKMIERLRLATSQNFGYDFEASIEDNEQAIRVWEQWWQEHKIAYGITEP